MPSQHNQKKKRDEGTPASQANNEQVQDQLAHYQDIAADLEQNTEAAQDEETLAPITALDEQTQLALMKELGKERTLEAANVLQALYTYASIKAVRKEARRSLIRLEASNIYPEWEPPSISLLDALPENLFASKQSRATSDEDEEAEIEETSLLSDLSTQFANLLPAAPSEMTIGSLLETWAKGDYGTVYDHLAANSDLREGLTRSEWIQRRKQWRKAAQPKELRVQFVTTAEVDGGPANVQFVEAGWSLVFTEVALDTPLPELPTATLVFPETGRHWFWSRYQVSRSQAIEAMSDEGTKMLSLPEAEVTERFAELTEIANERLQELQEEEEEFDEEEDELDLMDDEEEDDEEEDEDDEDEDEDFEEDDLDDIAAMMGQIQEAFSVTAIALSYSDALLAKQSANDATLYQTAYNLANAMADRERGAAYMSLMAERLPDRRGEALTELASSFALIASQYEEEEDSEQMYHFIDLAEQHLREAITLSNEPRSKILLAQVLMARNKQVSEAEDLLQQARKMEELDPRLEALATVSLARIAQERGENIQALNYFMEASTLQPDFPGLWLYIGHVQVELGHFDDAEQSLLRSIEQEPEAEDAYLELATIYNTHKHDPAKAEFIIGQGLEVVSDSADLLVAQAILLINKGEFHEAEQYLDEAEEIDPEAELLQDARDLLLISRQQKNQARPKQRKRKK